MVKIAIENIINSLLKKSPKAKVGLVNFESKIEIKGDCLSNIMIIKENDMNN
jgi:ubiquinone biosynthesis protein UbiJ